MGGWGGNLKKKINIFLDAVLCFVKAVLMYSRVSYAMGNIHTHFGEFIYLRVRGDQYMLFNMELEPGEH